jgi:hypothetical protein
MKKGTKKILAYSIAAATVYYIYTTRISTTMTLMPQSVPANTQMTLMPQSVPANTQGPKDPSLQFYGIGNPPNWY